MNDDFRKLQELLGKQEDLHPDLEEYLEQVNGMSMIRHPLVYSLSHVPQMNAWVNQQYERKRKACEECRTNGDFYQLVWFHERPYRLQAFETVQQFMVDREYWEFLGALWIESENIHQNMVMWTRALTRTRGDRIYFMNDKEQVRFAALPDQVEIYRGHDGRNPNGLSWTLDAEKAAWFSRRLGQGKPMVATRTVPRDAILAILDRRDEEEIVLLPRR